MESLGPVVFLAVVFAVIIAGGVLLVVLDDIALWLRVRLGRRLRRSL